MGRSQNNFITEFKVGLFSLICIAILSISAIFLGINPFAHKKQIFYSIVENANGIAPRTQVRIAGVVIGTVSAVNIIEHGAKIYYEIDNDLRITKGSTLAIKSKGILGDVYLEIIKNINNNEYLHTGEEIKFNNEVNDFNSLLSNLNDITRDIKQLIASQKQNTVETVEALHNSAIQIAKILQNNNAKINNIIDNINIFTMQLKKITDNTNLENVEHLLKNINSASLSLQHILAKMERGEGTIGQLLVKDDTANEIKNTIQNIKEVVKPIANLKLTITDRAEYHLANAAKNDKFYNEFNVKISTRANRYYLLGITTAPYSRRVKNISTTTSIDGNTTTQNIQENSPEYINYFRYNAQISQRLNFLALRFGLFQSSIGFATDFYALQDKLVSSIEVSQFNGSPIPSDTLYGSRGIFNLKAYVNYFISPNIFFTGGIDGLVLMPNPLPFLGAGLVISDDDLKSLLGIVSMGAR